jgi:hypothetical protein
VLSQLGLTVGGNQVPVTTQFMFLEVMRVVSIAKQMNFVYDTVASFVRPTYGSLVYFGYKAEVVRPYCP